MVICVDISWMLPKPYCVRGFMTVCVANLKWRIDKDFEVTSKFFILKLFHGIPQYLNNSWSIFQGILRFIFGEILQSAQAYLSTCRAENTGGPLCSKLWEAITQNPYSWPLTSDQRPPTARILSCLSSAQPDLIGESQENIRKPKLAILTLNNGS